jgi:4'-phosphopantetheinyl transferase
MTAVKYRDADLNANLMQLTKERFWTQLEDQTIEFHIRRLDDLGAIEESRPTSWRAVLGGASVAAKTVNGEVDLLHPREHEKLDQFHMEKRKLEYLAGRVAIKRALNAYLCNNEMNHQFAQDIEIKNDIFNRPYVDLSETVNLNRIDSPQLGLTHSHSLALGLAYPRFHPFGIDVEKISQNHPEVVGSEMSPMEKKLFENLSFPKEEISYTLNWTIKESYSKAIGVGLTTPFKLFEVETIKGHNGYFESWLKNFHQFRVHSWVLGEFVFSVAVPYKTQLSFSVRSTWPELKASGF